MLAPRAVSKAALLLAFNPFSCLEFLIQWFPTSSETVIGKQASRRLLLLFYLYGNIRKHENIGYANKFLFSAIIISDRIRILSFVALFERAFFLRVSCAAMSKLMKWFVRHREKTLYLA